MGQNLKNILLLNEDMKNMTLYIMFVFGKNRCGKSSLKICFGVQGLGLPPQVLSLVLAGVINMSKLQMLHAF